MLFFNGTFSRVWWETKLQGRHTLRHSSNWATSAALARRQATIYCQWVPRPTTTTPTGDPAKQWGRQVDPMLGCDQVSAHLCLLLFSPPGRRCRFDSTAFHGAGPFLHLVNRSGSRFRWIPMVREPTWHKSGESCQQWGREYCQVAVALSS